MRPSFIPGTKQIRISRKQRSFMQINPNRHIFTICELYMLVRYDCQDIKSKHYAFPSVFNSLKEILVPEFIRKHLRAKALPPKPTEIHISCAAILSKDIPVRARFGANLSGLYTAEKSPVRRLGL